MSHPFVVKPLSKLEFVSCETCPLGPGHGQVSFCRFITRQFVAGETVFRRGQPGDYVWFVKEGLIGLASSETEPPSLTQVAGGFIGDVLSENGCYPHTATVLINATLCGAPRAEFDRMQPSSEEKP